MQSSIKIYFHKKNFIERPLPLFHICWQKNVDIPTINDSFATLAYLFPNKKNLNIPFQQALKTALLKTSYVQFTSEQFDREVSNHFSLTNLTVTSLLQLPRPNSIKILFHSEKISPIILGIFCNTLVLLDGNHRSICARLAHIRIHALVLDFTPFVKKEKLWM